MLFEALRSLIMGAAGEALMGDRRLTPAPVEDRNPPSSGNPERAQQVQDFVRQFGGEQQAPQQAQPQGAITRPYRPTGDSSAMFRSAEPLDIAAMNEGRLMPADQVLRPDQEEFLSRKYDQQKAPQKIDSYKQLVKQKTEEELSQLPPEVRNQEGIVDKAAAYSNVALSPQLSKIEEADPELGAQIQSTMKNAFGNEEMWLRLSLAFNSLRHRPDATLANAVTSRLKTIEATKGSSVTVQKLRGMGRNDLADLVASGQLKPKEGLSFALKSPKTSYETMTYGEYGAKYGKAVPPGMENELINVSSQGKIEPFYDKPVSEALTGALAPEVSKRIEKIYSAAEIAVPEVKKIDELVGLLEKPDAVNTGMFADLKQARDRFFAEFDSEEARKKASNTELLEAWLGSEVFAIFARMGFGSKNMDTPAEREFLRQVMTGKKEFTPEALVSLAKRRRREHLESLDTYQKYRGGRAMKSYVEDYGVPEIEFKSEDFKGEQFPGFSIAGRG